MRRTLLVIGTLIAMTLSMCVVHPLVPVDASLAQSSLLSNAVPVLGGPLVGTPTPVSSSKGTGPGGGSNTKPSNSLLSGLDPTAIVAVIVAVITGSLAIIGVILTGIFLLFNTRFTHMLAHSVKMEEKEEEEFAKFKRDYPASLSNKLAGVTRKGYPSLRVQVPDKKNELLPASFPSKPCEADVWIRAEQKELRGRIRNGHTEELSVAIKRGNAEKLWVIVGSVGVGKTVWLKTMALDALETNFALFPGVELPIFVAMEKFTDFCVRLKKFPLFNWRYYGKNLLLIYIAKMLIKNYGLRVKEAKVLEYLEGELSQGHVLLLLDGLDKALDSLTPKKVVDIIQRFRNQGFSSNQKSPMILTARERFDPILVGFQYLWVENFTQEDIYTFVRKWGEAEESQTSVANEATVLLSRSLYLQALVANAHAIFYLLTKYKELSASGHSLHDRAKVCKDYSEALLKECNITKEERGLLERIAWKLHKAGLHCAKKATILKELPHSIVKKGFHREKLNSEDLFEALLAKHGLLRESADVKGHYGLLSYPLHEYFAAMYVVHYYTGDDNIYRDATEKPLDVLKNNRYNPRWEEVISLYLQYAPSPQKDFLEELAGLQAPNNPPVALVAPNNPPAQSWSLPADTQSYASHILVGRGVMNNLDYQSNPATKDMRVKIKLCVYGVLLHNVPAFVHELIASAFFEIDKRIDRNELESLEQSLSPQDEAYFPFIPQLREVLKLLERGTELSPLFLYLLSSVSPDMQTLLIEFAEMSKDGIKRKLEEPAMDDEIRKRMVAALFTKGGGSYAEMQRDYAKILSELLPDTNITKNIRVMMACALALLAQPPLIEALAQPPLIEALFMHLDDKTLDHQIRWSLIKTLGVLGSRGIGGSSIAADLLLRLTHGHNLYIDDQYLRWHIAVMLIVFLGYENGNEKLDVLDKLSIDQFSEPVKSGIRVLRVDSDGRAKAIEDLLGKVRAMGTPTLEQCIEISEIVGYLTMDARDVSGLRDIWSQTYQSVLPPELEECLKYVQWVVDRRFTSAQALALSPPKVPVQTVPAQVSIQSPV